MAVIVKYIVVRNGVEKMTFATKKEADAHDKMLDIADNLFEFLEMKNIGLDEKQMENISLVFAENRDKIVSILRGIKPKAKESQPVPEKTKSEKTKSEKTKSEKTGALVSKASTAADSGTASSASKKKSQVTGEIKND